MSGKFQYLMNCIQHNISNVYVRLIKFHQRSIGSSRKCELSSYFAKLYQVPTLTNIEVTQLSHAYSLTAMQLHGNFRCTVRPVI